MPIGIAPVLGMPGFSNTQTAGFKHVFRGGFNQDHLPGGRVLQSGKARDLSNTSQLSTLQPGTLLGKITSGGKYGSSVIGLSGGALTSTGTTVTSSAAIATELIRRIGSTGTFKITGPPTSSGTVRTLTATYSNANTSTGDLTIAALGVNEVQTLTFGAAATGGTMRLRVPKANGELVLTDAITWNGTDATWLSNINTALDAATGVSGGIVATGGAPDTTLIFTFSGTGYAALSQPTEMISVETLPTSTTTADVVRTTTGVDGRFVTASLIQPTDGSETILTFVPDGSGIRVVDNDGSDIDVPFPEFPIAGIIETAQLIYYSSLGTPLKNYVKAALNAQGKFVYDDGY